MTAVLVQVAEAVKDLLNGHTFSQPVQAERTYPNFSMELKDLNTLRVDVVAVGHPTSELATRGSVNYLCHVDIGIRKKFEREDREADTRRVSNEAIDPLVYLVEELHEFLCGEDQRRLTNPAGLDATWSETKIRATYIKEHLKDWSQFTGIIRVGYEARKDLE